MPTTHYMEKHELHKTLYMHNNHSQHQNTDSQFQHVYILYSVNLYTSVDSSLLGCDAM